jgi:arginine/lysine/ornithine decarboxylase
MTKLTVNTRSTGLSGIEVYDLLRDEYDIQVEFGDLQNFLAIMSVGDRPAAIERLIGALEDIKQNYGTEPAKLVVNEYISPEVVMTPAEAFYKPSEQLSLEKCCGRIATESVMCYPPGIPILAPGERVTPGILEYIQYARDKGSLLTGTEDPEVRQLYVMLE